MHRFIARLPSTKTCAAGKQQHPPTTTIRRAMTVMLNPVLFYAGFHSAASRAAISRFNMPAMSPTMTEGTIHQWKVKEGKHSNNDKIRCGYLY